MSNRMIRYFTSLLSLVAFLVLSNQAKAAYPYNFPTYSKVKITRDLNGASWLYMEFMWGEGCPPNFEKGKAVEFEIGIVPKCFLRPKGGADNEFNCEKVMGVYGVGFSLPNKFIPNVGPNCYVDIWNYTNPSAYSIVSEIEENCGDLTWQGEFCAEGAAASNAFVDSIGNFAIGLHDASALKAGELYSFRYPVEVNDSSACTGALDGTYANGGWCSSDTPIWENRFSGYSTPGSYSSSSTIYEGWGRAQVTMQTFNNECDLPATCDASNNTYTCPHLIGVATNVGECENVQKKTDLWLTKLCVPTGDYTFTPGVALASGHTGECFNHQNTINLDTNGECCIDLDHDGYYANSSSELYGRQVNDCNDANANINPGESEICGDYIDNNCDGYSKNVCISGGPGGSGGSCPNNSECETGDQVSVLCLNGIDQELKVCNDSCEWEFLSECPPDPCDNPICNPGEPQTQGCGNGGEQISTCTNECEWGPWGNCTGENSCQPNTQQLCGNCGTMTCGSSGQWGSCFNQGVCSPNTPQNQTCNDVGTQTKTCLNNCTWSGWGTCSAECTPGQPADTQPCTIGSQSGTQTRNCNLNGTWTSWSTCIISCQCSSGACCDGCNYYSSSHICNGYYIYQCQGSNPGQDAQKAAVNTNCSGYSEACNGQISQGSWLLNENCSSSQECQMNGGMSECVPITTCQDTYIASTSNACYTSSGTQYGYTTCLQVQQVSGSSWKYRICKDSGTFPYGIKYQLFDQNNSSQSMGGQYQEGGGNSCTNWRNFSVSHITQYGSINGAGLRGEIITPPSCTLNSCKYKTGLITIRKECQ